MTNKSKSTLYVGVTSNLLKRVYEHKHHRYPQSFTARYNLEFCVYYESFPGIEEAIFREKQLKKWRRDKKNELIKSFNPRWEDMYEEISKW